MTELLSDKYYEKRVAALFSAHPTIHLLAVERTGWRRWLFGRWAYNSEPFRRDIQRLLAAVEYSSLHRPDEQFYPPEDLQ